MITTRAPDGANNNIMNDSFFHQQYVDLMKFAQDILNDPETMAFAGELSKLCWGIVTSDQVRLFNFFCYNWDHLN